MKKVKRVTRRLFHRRRPSQPLAEEPPAGELAMDEPESFMEVRGILKEQVCKLLTLFVYYCKR
jgi:hypothetical protein